MGLPFFQSIPNWWAVMDDYADYIIAETIEEPIRNVLAAYSTNPHLDAETYYRWMCVQVGLPKIQFDGIMPTVLACAMQILYRPRNQTE